MLAPYLVLRRFAPNQSVRLSFARSGALRAPEHGLYRLYTALFYGHLYIIWCRYIEIHVLCQENKYSKEYITGSEFFMKLPDQVSEVIRKKHYSIRTEQTSIDWIKRPVFDCH